jgi:hypothetical protein
MLICLQIIIIRGHKMFTQYYKIGYLWQAEY